MQQPWYATREQVKRALDSAETARNNMQVDRAISAASQAVEALCHRRFAPITATKYIGYPRRDENRSWRVFLNGHDLISVTSLMSASTTIASTDYFLEPVNDGPPFTEVQIDRSSNAVFGGGDTWQRNITIAGTWGYWEELERVGELGDTLEADVNDVGTVSWDDPSKVGVGSILKIDDERIIVTEMTFVSSSQDTGNSLTASAAANTIEVISDTSFYVGEVIQVDSEFMLVVDVSDAELVVRRAWDGSVLAAHTSGAEIFGRTGAQVTRACLGTSAAEHIAGDVVYRWVVPELINQLCVAEAMALLQSEQAGYGRSSGSGESERSIRGSGLQAIRTQAFAQYGRKARTYAI